MAYFTNIDGKYVKDVVLRDDIAYIKNAIGYDNILGLQADFENNTFTRLAGAAGKSMGSDFDVFPMYGGRRKCNLADDGTINAWYGEQGYTEDGSNGQVMVYQPKFYYRVVPLKLEKIIKDLGKTTTDIVTDNTTNPIDINGESITAELNDAVFYNDVKYRWSGSKWTTEGANCTGSHLLKAQYYISSVPVIGFKVHPAFVDKETGKVCDGVYENAYTLVGNTQSKSYKRLTNEDSFESGRPYYTYNYQTMFVETEVTESNFDEKVANGLYTPFTTAHPSIATQLSAINSIGSGWVAKQSAFAEAIKLLMAVECGTFNLSDALGLGFAYVSAKALTWLSGSTANIGNGTGKAEKAYYSDFSNIDNNHLPVIWRGKENPFAGFALVVPDVILDYFGCVYYSNNTNGVITSSGVLPSGYNLIQDVLTYTNGSHIKYFSYSPVYDWMFLPSMGSTAAQSAIGSCLYYSRVGLNWRYAIEMMGEYAYVGPGHYRTILTRYFGIKNFSYGVFYNYSCPSLDLCYIPNT